MHVCDTCYWGMNDRPFPVFITNIAAERILLHSNCAKLGYMEWNVKWHTITNTWIFYNPLWLANLHCNPLVFQEHDRRSLTTTKITTKDFLTNRWCWRIFIPYELTTMKTIWSDIITLLCEFCRKMISFFLYSSGPKVTSYYVLHAITGTISAGFDG